MKKLVRFSFSRFSESYDREAVLQKESAKILVEFGGKLEGKGVDLGCGTGFLYRYSDWKNVVGVDISKDMVQFYSRFNRRAVVADMEQLPLKDSSFDFAVSNFSLHWTDLEKSFSEVRRVLKPEGVFLFSIPVGGSLSAVEEILGNTQFDFLCVPEILQLLKEKGFNIKEFFVEELKKEFKDGYSLLMHLHRTGVTVNPEKKLLSEKRKIVEKFKSYNKPAVLNFKTLFVYSCL
ncbi:methyltransferase domain-containing protein [Persephonella sp.]